MRNLLCLFFILCIHSAQAADYYFSSVSGDDSRTAAEAQNPSTPWKTLSKLNSFFNKVQPGDALLLKRNETFYGSILVTKSGLPGAPITIGAYGTGSKPVITGLTTLTNWVAVGNGIYECHNALLGSKLNILLINNDPQPVGRFPNTGYLNIESHSGRTSVTNAAITSALSWKDAELVIRPVHWKLDRYQIKSQSGNSLYYNGNAEPKDNFGFFIQNSVKALDQFGEWYYNPDSKKVSMYFGSKSPRSYEVSAAAIDDLISSSRRSYVVFDNLTFKGADKTGMTINRGNNITVKNSEILFSGADGVKVANHAYFTIENCKVSHSYNNGIAAGSGNTYAVIKNNTVRNSYYAPGMGQSGDGQGAGIRINTNGLAEYNKVINSGYIGIQFGGDFCVVKNNVIDTFCYIKDDGGAIYAYNGLNITNKGRKVIGNIVLNGLGASDGTDTKSSSAEGIYLDDNTNGVEITDNTISNCNRGIFIHNSRQIIVKNNTSYNNNNGQLNMKHDGLGDPLRNNTIINNIFFSKMSRQFVSSINSIENDINKTGKFDNNYYARPLNEGVTIYNSFVNGSGQKISASYDLETWKAQYKYDKSSKSGSRKIAGFKIKNLVGQNMCAAGSFNTSKNEKVWGNSCKINWENAGLLDQGYLKIVPSAKTSSVVLGIGALSSSKKYILKYSVKGSSSMSIRAFLRSPEYKAVTATEYRSVTTERRDDEIIFSPSSNQNASSLVLTTDNQNTYYLDNIQLYEADATLTNPDDSIKFVYNSTNAVKIIYLDGSYADVKDNSYASSITLQPFSSAVLIKDHEIKKSVQNAAPTVSITSPETKAVYKAKATLTISADAFDTDGSVAQVEFYNGTTLLHTELNTPYTFNWENVDAGNYTITAKAKDNNGNTTISESVNISVASASEPVNAAPEVSLITPKTNASYKTSATIFIRADARDADGSIKQVDFYSGDNLLHTELKAPFGYYWLNVPAGNYTITAKATDNTGNVSISKSITITVASTQAKSSTEVILTSPKAKATYAEKAKIEISADAVAKDGKIKKVDFYNGTKLLHTEVNGPYNYTWHGVKAGNYTITAVATDDKGVAVRSESVNISVTAKKTSNRDIKNNNTAIAVNNYATADTAAVTVHALNLRREEADKAAPLTYNVKVFPNPAVNKIQISIEGLQTNNQKANLTIQTLSGITVKSIPVRLSGKTLEADINSLSPNMYIISIVSDNFSISKKFIKS